MVTEITVVLKSDDKTYREKFLCYEPVMLVAGDLALESCIKTARAGFVGDPEEIIIKATMVYA